MVLTFSMLICTCKKKYIVVQSTNIWDIIDIRPVVPGGAGGAMAPPDFGRSVNPISTKGADYAHQIVLAPPDFQIFRRPWIFKGKRIKIFFEICFVKILMLTATYRFATIFWTLWSLVLNFANNLLFVSDNWAVYRVFKYWVVFFHIMNHLFRKTIAPMCQFGCVTEIRNCIKQEPLHLPGASEITTTVKSWTGAHLGK